jgi:hypothetical protein
MSSMLLYPLNVYQEIELLVQGSELEILALDALDEPVAPAFHANLISKLQEN